MTAILLLDPLNDILDPRGKMWPDVREVAVGNGMLSNMRAIVDAARGQAVRIFFLSCRRSRPDDLAGWQHASPAQLRAARLLAFASGSWGGDWHPDFRPGADDVVVDERWAQDAFASTDLDLQLCQHGVRRVILIGPGANTSVEATGRSAAERGYHVTLVRDATAASSDDRMRAAHELNGPTFAHCILRTADLLWRLRWTGRGGDGR